MKVTAIAKTQPLIKGINTAEELLSYCARVSNPENQLNTATADKLLGYCWRSKHVSIFEQADLTLEIQTSRAISAQIIRHRSFVFQEFSQRYQAVTTLEPIKLRRQDKKNRQNSTDDLELKSKQYYSTKLTLLMDEVKKVYEEMLDDDIAKECARMILPMTTQTTMYMKGNVRSWIGYCIVRCGQETQAEHREVARACWKIVREHFPAVAKFVEAEYSYLSDIN